MDGPSPPCDGSSTSSKDKLSPSISEPDTSINTGVSSGTSREISSLTGASFTGLTIRSKYAVSDSNPSLAVTMIFAVPFQFNSGVTVKTSPETLTTIFSFKLDAL